MAADFAQLVKGARRRSDGEWWDAKCPAHEDTHASLSFADGDKGLIVKCQRGCPLEQVTAAAGCSVADLFSRNGNGPAVHDFTVLTTYDYQDAASTLRYQVVRLDPKDFRCRRPDGADGWTWNMQGVRRLPYRLPELAGQARVYVPEGEKDVDTLRAAGLPATCNEGGANKWRPEHTAALVAAGVREVVVVPDHDAVGAAHGRLVARTCLSAGLAVRMLELPGLPDKGDVSDWLAAAWPEAQHTPTELVTLADAAPTVTAADVTEPVQEPRGGRVPDGPVLVRLDTVAPEPVEWLWAGRSARGKLGLVVGDPGEGKSQVVIDALARTTRGLPWPDGGIAPMGNVVLLAAEDGLADTVRPRFDRQGGDPARVSVLKAVRVDGQEYPFTLERDLPALEAAIQQNHAVAVGIDPISAYLGTRNSYKDSEIRGLLTPLAALAEQYGVALIGILHLTKDAQRRLLMRAQGSIAFVAQARTVLAVGSDPEIPGRRLLVPIKNNLGPFPPALGFRLGDEGLCWEPGAVEGSAEQLLAVDELGSRTDRKERDAAVTFLRDTLAAGMMTSKELQADAEANGIARRTLWRAKTDLSVVTERHGRAWYWMLPQREPAP